MRLSSLVEAHVRAILISKKVTREGEVIPYAQTELTVGTDSEGEEDELFFIWPTTIIHKINQDSPFYDMSAKDFLKKRYEIVVILEGVVEQTGNSIQVALKLTYLFKDINLLPHPGQVLLSSQRGAVGLQICQLAYFQTFRF